MHRRPRPPHPLRFALAGLLWRRDLGAWPAFAVAGLVAVSRVYLGVHLTTDIVAGAAFGALIGVMTVWTAGRAAPLGRLLLPT